jgi:hypothetical protein
LHELVCCVWAQQVCREGLIVIFGIKAVVIHSMLHSCCTAFALSCIHGAGENENTSRNDEGRITCKHMHCPAL